MKKILSIITMLIIFVTTGLANEANAWVNEDINQGLNAKIDKISPELKTYLNEVVLKELTAGYKESNSKKDWKVQISFHIDPNGKVYKKNYVIKDDYWINRDAEYAMMKLNKVSAPPKEYNQEAIFVTFKHINGKTDIHFINVNED